MGLAVGSGSLVGFSLGLIGGGGSILATPLLLYVVGLSPPHLAIGTSALAVAFNAFLNFSNYARKGTVHWRSAIIFAVVGSIGAFAGSSLGKQMNGDRLLFLFGLLMVLVGALMLRPDVVEAIRAERFHVYAVATVEAGIELLTGVPAGVADAYGHYPEGTVFGAAETRLRRFHDAVVEGRRL